ncbi:YhgE/Pip domain-containing protein [Corynebacterium sp. UBA2622]|uniref:YhgE/Pip domain-containing protein n=1 Tax=Corynebacterium sp. UBA2622 TaxID=1946393 RepID=UPI0025BD9485|nr:YhgE/Pip domain-containing protein [Corynebacterium sp. UBA2622]
MRTVFSIAFNDLRRLYTNVMAGIVMVGLIAIPCLFAWFNVLATWNPFQNTERLQVAVANTDRGHTSDLTPLSVNVGDMVLSQLYRNDDMDWVITDAADAVEGAKSGEYYAAIVLPPTLSDDMFTFYSGDAEPSKIDLYVNEKKNPIAPLLISNGTQGVSAQINASFTRALSEVSFGLIETASDFFNEAETQKALNSIETRVVGTRNQMLSSANTVDALAALTESSVPLVASAERISSSVGANLDSIQPANLDGIGAGVGGSAAALGAALSATSDSFGPVNDRVNELLANTDQTSAATATTLTSIAAAVDVQVNQYTALRDQLNANVSPALPPEAQPAFSTVIGNLNDAIARQTGVRDRLNDAASRVATGRATQGDRQEIQESIAKARDAIATARNSFDTGVRPRLEALSGSVDQIGGSVDKARADIDRISATLADRPGSLQNTLATSGDTLRSLATELRDNAAQLGDAQRSIADARSSNDLGKLSDLVSKHPEEIANALVDPVKVDRQEVYPRVSFGAGMAPLYTVLALWVGALLTAVALRSDENSFVQHSVDPSELSPAQKYFGRYLTFAVTGLAQSTLIMAGLILYVEIHPAHPFLLFVAGWVSSLVFHMICYTLVLSLSNAGKAIGVLILVLQISAAGGAYPLQLLPGWVHALSPWLPATYSIQAMRAAEFGTYHWDFWRAIGILLLFAVPFLVLGLWVRSMIESTIMKMEDAAAETKIIMTA